MLNACRSDFSLLGLVCWPDTNSGRRAVLPRHWAEMRGYRQSLQEGAPKGLGCRRQRYLPEAAGVGGPNTPKPLHDRASHSCRWEPPVPPCLGNQHRFFSFLK